MKKTRTTKKIHPTPKHIPTLRQVELEVLPGLEPEAMDEVRELLGPEGLDAAIVGAGAIQVTTREFKKLHTLRTVVAVYGICRLMVPRPGTLLGVEYRALLVGFLKQIVALSEFRSFRISAAGKDSSVFQDLRTILERELRLKHDPEEGDLLLRFRPSPEGGWDVLGRTTPRPLSVRSWRTVDMPGALNATIAAAMVRHLSAPAGAPWLNICSGSGSLLIEGKSRHPSLKAIGVEVDRRRIGLGSQNIAAARNEEGITSVRADGGTLPMRSESIHAIVADLPWGERVGRRADNHVLYSRILAEASRVLLPRRRMQLITQDGEALERALQSRPELRITQAREVFQKGYQPTWFEVVKG